MFPYHPDGRASHFLRLVRSLLASLRGALCGIRARHALSGHKATRTAR